MEEATIDPILMLGLFNIAALTIGGGMLIAFVGRFTEPACDTLPAPTRPGCTDHEVTIWGAWQDHDDVTVEADLRVWGYDDDGEPFVEDFARLDGTLVDEVFGPTVAAVDCPYCDLQVLGADR